MWGIQGGGYNVPPGCLLLLAVQLPPDSPRPVENFFLRIDNGVLSKYANRFDCPWVFIKRGTTMVEKGIGFFLS